MPRSRSPADRVRRRWLLLDEVASLGRVQGLSDALTKGRKYGLCAMMGLQSVVAVARCVRQGRRANPALVSIFATAACERMTPRPPSTRAGIWAIREVLRESISQGQAPHRHSSSTTSSVWCSLRKSKGCRIVWVTCARGSRHCTASEHPVDQTRDTHGGVRAAKLSTEALPRRGIAGTECAPSGPRCGCDSRPCAGNRKRKMKEWLIALVLLVTEPRGTGAGS